MSFDVDEDLALLYGIMLGDGCLSLVSGKKKFVTITGSSRDDLPFFVEVVSPLLKKFRGKETKIKFRKDCDAIEFNFTDKNLFDFLHSLGFPIGKKGDKLFIPRVFYDENLVEHVINGFFATDGSLVLTRNPNKYYPRLEAHVISKTLLFEIYSYLLSIGMNGGFYLNKSKPDPRWRTSQDKYRFQFNGKENLIKFRKAIGFVNPKYEEKFNNFINYSDEYDLRIKGQPSTKLKMS
ncbi:MAG: LAGLIDADG family homing endonuclease [Nanoarchaeota archaeon]